MGKFWSAGAGGFFDEDIHGAKLIAAQQTAREIKAGKRPKMVPNPDCIIPADAVAISDQTYNRLLDEQSAGLEIVDLGNGPLARTRELDPETRQTMRQRQRDRLLAASDWTQLGDTLVDEPQLKSAWAAYRQALRDLNMDAEDWPETPVSS